MDADHKQEAEQYRPEDHVGRDALVNEPRREYLPHHQMPTVDRARQHRGENLNKWEKRQCIQKSQESRRQLTRIACKMSNLHPTWNKLLKKRSSFSKSVSSPRGMSTSSFSELNPLYLLMVTDPGSASSMIFFTIWRCFVPFWFRMTIFVVRRGASDG